MHPIFAALICAYVSVSLPLNIVKKKKVVIFEHDSFDIARISSVVMGCLCRSQTDVLIHFAFAAKSFFF